jgi:spore coat protein U-like protein
MRKMIFIMAMVALIATSAFAYDTTTSITVSGVLNPFAYVYAGNLSFGGFVTGDSYRYASTYVYVYASYGLPYVVTLDNGLSPWNSYYRSIANSGNIIPYSLNNGGYGWGDNGYGNTDLNNARYGTGTGGYDYWQVDGTLYAYIANSSYPSGYYSDTVTVTVYY